MEHKAAEARTSGDSVTIALPDCARHLWRLLPRYEESLQGLVSDLIQQCNNYERGNTYLARRMIETMERIRAFI